MLLNMVDQKQGHIINVGTMIKGEKDFLISKFEFNLTTLDSFCECIWKIVQLSNNWLDITGSEFILDPEYYHCGENTFKRTCPCPKICGQSRRCFCVRNESQLPSKSENASDSKELADVPVKELWRNLVYAM